MIRLRAQKRFRRYFLHAIRNGDDTETAADVALTQVKEEIQQLLDEKAMCSLEHETWERDVFPYLVEWQMLLRDIPIDRAELIRRKAAMDAAEEAADAADQAREGNCGDRPQP